MDEATRQRILDKSKQMFASEKNGEKVAEAFVEMVLHFDKNPEDIREKFGELGKLNWQKHRNYYAELGVEVTPEEYQLYCDLYQLAMDVWEEEALKGGH
jgi:hypothetical protein